MNVLVIHRNKRPMKRNLRSSLDNTSRRSHSEQTMAMKPSARPQKKERRSNRMTRTQQKTKQVESIETKADSDRDEYSRQQQEHRKADLHISKPAAAKVPQGDYGPNDANMKMPALQMQGTPEELPMTYRADAYGRIPRPHDNDVLCGRGGSINSHPGNKTFRDWVYTRKTQYNLADSKREKTDVVNEVLGLVRGLRPPGRFLQKYDESYWNEIDDAKAMAKISQALREGAPAMRAAHGKKANKRRSSSTRSPSPPKRESKRKPKKRNFDDYVPSETMTASNELSLSNAAISSAPLTPPPSLDGNDEYHHEDLVGNEQAYNSFYHAGGLNDLLDPNNNSQSHSGGDYNASFISPSLSHSRPLIPFGDYSAPISEVANAIPPSRIEEQHSTANNVTPTLTALPPPPITPGGYDPLSFLPSTPKHSRASVEGMNGQTFFPLTPNHTNFNHPTSPINHAEGQFLLQQKQPVHREHSLDVSVGSFSNPFENDSVHFRQYPQSGGPPERGLSFGKIGGMPREVDASLRRDTSSHSSMKSSSPSANDRKRPPL